MAKTPQEFVDKLAIRVTPQEEDIEYVLDQFIQHYTYSRSKVPADLAEREWGPLEQDLVGVLSNCIEFIMTSLTLEFLNVAMKLMMARGMTQGEFVNHLAAHMMELEISSLLGAKARVHNVNPVNLEEYMVNQFGDEGRAMAEEMRAEMAKRQTVDINKRKEVLH